MEAKKEQPKKQSSAKPKAKAAEAGLRSRVKARMSLDEYDSWLYTMDSADGFDSDELAALREAKFDLGPAW